MESKKLIFYNHFHNGDIHSARNFVKDIMSKIEYSETIYYHENSSTILKDIYLKHIKDKYPTSELFIENDNEIIINTWFHTQHGHRHHQCTLEALYYNFTIIYKNLDIKLEPIEYYIPTVDYNKFKIENIDNFFNDRKYKKYVYMANGPIRSFQSMEENMDRVIGEISKNKDNLIIIANDSNFKDTNVIESKDIIGSKGIDDLNENSYLTTKCDVIIGRESGPYFFSYVKENTSSDLYQRIIVSSNVMPFLGEKYYNSNKDIFHISGFINKIDQIKKMIN